MKQMVIMRGVPGSGKSTLARQIFNDHIYANISKVILATDDIISANGYYLWCPELIAASHNTNRLKCLQACKLGIELIIIDQVNYSFAHMRPYAEYGFEYGYNISCRLPNNSWSWDAEECYKRNTHDVPLESIQTKLDRFVPQHTIDNMLQNLKAKYEKV